MPRAAAVRSADLDRVVKILVKNGLGVAMVEVRAGGVVTITPGLTADAQGEQLGELEAWRARRAGRATKGA